MIGTFVRRFATILLPAALLLVLAGCGGKQPTASQGPSQQGQGSQAAPGGQAAQGGQGGSAGTTQGGEAIKLGGLFCSTGAVAEVGRPGHEGSKYYIDYVNSKGGINGRRVQLIDIEYNYETPKALEGYKRLTTQEKVTAILGCSTADTEALRGQVAKDKVLYTSLSFSERLASTSEAPFNFLVGATYSDQARAALRYALQHFKPADRPLRLAFVHPDNPYGHAVDPEVKAFVQENNIQVVTEQFLNPTDMEATSQVLNVKNAKPDVILHHNTSAPAAVFIKELKKQGVNIPVLHTMWATGEPFNKLAGAEAEGVYGAMAATPLSASVPGLKEMEEALKLKGLTLSDITQYHVIGWVEAKVMLELFKRAGSDLSGENLRKQLESIKDFDLGGLMPSVSYTSEDHRGSHLVKIQQVKNGKWTVIADNFDWKKP